MWKEGANDRAGKLMDAVTAMADMHDARSPLDNGHDDELASRSRSQPAPSSATGDSAPGNPHRHRIYSNGVGVRLPLAV